MVSYNSEKQISSYVSQFQFWLNPTHLNNPLFDGHDVWADAYAWYPLVHDWVKVYAVNHNIEPIPAMGAFAILSQNKLVELNVLNFQLLVQEHHANYSVELFKERSHKTAIKARACLRDGDIGNVKGSKIISFFDNILNGNASISHTTDLWMWRALNLTARKTIDHRGIQIAAMRVAGEMNIPVPVLQAYVWIVVRSTLNVRPRYAADLSLFS